MKTLKIPKAIITDNFAKDLAKHLNQIELEWLNDALNLLTASQDKINDLLDLSAVVNRTLTSDVQLNNTFISAPTCAECVRLLLIKVALIGLTDTEQGHLLKQYYRGADASEKIAWLKGLVYIDKQGFALNTAINASRSNSVNEFSALALNNKYVAQHFPELNFNQLVLKSLFMGLDINAVTKLSSRLNVKLSNMCFSFAIEQALADRIPPASIWLAIRPDDLNEENSPLLTQYLHHFYQRDDIHKPMITAFCELNKLKNIIIQ